MTKRANKRARVVPRLTIEPLKAYERIQYECIRCGACFPSITGPQMFCVACRAALAPGPDTTGEKR